MRNQSRFCYLVVLVLASLLSKKTYSFEVKGPLITPSIIKHSKNGDEVQTHVELSSPVISEEKEEEVKHPVHLSLISPERPMFSKVSKILSSRKTERPLSTEQWFKGTLNQQLKQLEPAETKVSSFTSTLTEEPSSSPSEGPNEERNLEPTEEPSEEPSEEPTEEPTIEPSAKPSISASGNASKVPSAEPTLEPTLLPTANATVPTNYTTNTTVPSAEPTLEPTLLPTANAT
eukprot:gene14188-15687_t